jgi:hypothetical protein
VIDPPEKESVAAEALVRSVGYDPAQLTPRECDELADILDWDEKLDVASANATTP